MAISQIMSRNLITLDMDDTLADAKDIFERYEMHHILIIEQEKLVGVLSDRDLLQHLSPTIGTRKETPQDSFILNKKIHLIMSRHLITASEDITLNEAVLLFYDNKISCIPVINEKNFPVGIITWRDIIKVIAVQYRRKTNQN
ncbi:MAG: CBS domain-containing protein [Cognaticolwellia sp.]